MKSNIAWITWERQQRNISMAKLFGAEYYEFNDIKKGSFRYLVYAKRTWDVFRKKYAVIFVQNPSLILSFLAVVFGKILSIKVVIDAHNAGVRPLEGRNRLLQAVNKFILRQASFVIVSNHELKKYLEISSVSSYVLPDPLPAMHVSYDKSKGLLAHDVLVVCSWAEDEPIKEYLLAAKELHDLSFAFTGNFKKYLAVNDKTEIPDNVSLLGFVSESDYVWFMENSKVIVDVTMRDDCLVCGAYEAISLNRVVILSDTLVNRELFGEVAFYSKVSVEGFVDVIKEAHQDYSLVQGKIKSFKKEYTKKLLVGRDNILSLLNK